MVGVSGIGHRRAGHPQWSLMFVGEYRFERLLGLLVAFRLQQPVTEHSCPGSSMSAYGTNATIRDRYGLSACW